KCTALPFTVLFFTTDSPAVAIGAYACTTLFANSYLGPTFAMLQGLAPLRMRALWAAITLLAINLIGLGLGPTSIGALSDTLVPYVGKADSLRWALVAVVALTPWAIFHYWRAGVILKRRQEQVTAAT
ncbi:MAG: MFS transporter, partial [Pseudomonadota bacterium]|nr:MFS transporter [Pseudomonadota bacterium]